MELLEVYRCPEFIYPAVYAAKFKHVKNAGAIRERIVKAATMEGPEGDKERDAVSFAFINAKLVSAFMFAPIDQLGLIDVAPDYQSSPSPDCCHAGALCPVGGDHANKDAPFRDHMESQPNQ